MLLCWLRKNKIFCEIYKFFNLINIFIINFNNNIKKILVGILIYKNLLLFLTYINNP